MDRFIEGLEGRRLMSVARYDVVLVDDGTSYFRVVGFTTPGGRVNETYESTNTVDGTVLASGTGRVHTTDPASGDPRGARFVTSSKSIDFENGTVSSYHEVVAANGVLRTFGGRTRVLK